MSYAPVRARSRAPWIALLLTPLLALASALVPAAGASAAPGDVAGATLNWGFKQSFRGYVAGAAHGVTTATGVDTTTPYGWTGGVGAMSDGTGTVAYPGSLRFQGHQGLGVPADEYALDITVSDVRVRVTSATAAELQADVVSRDMSTGEFGTHSDVVIATLDLSSGTTVSTSDTLAYTGVPATLTAAGAPAFAGFYAVGTALDPVSFGWPVEQAPVTRTLTVSQTTDLDPDGATITITGTGYDTAYANTHGGGKAGVYLQIGWLDSTWRPSQGAPTSTRNQAFQRWVKENPTAGLYHQWTETSATRADFTITTTITKAQLDAIARDGATLAVFTIGAGGAVQAENELAVPISFATPPGIPGGTPGGGGAPGAGETETPAMGAGSLTWGVKAGWRAYVIGPIAAGSIVTTGVTTRGGAFTFPQSADAALRGGLGSVAYSGTVRFTGHHGELDLRVSNPQVRIDSATSATLFVTVNGSTVPFADLALGSASRTTAADGSVSYSGVPAKLTAAGASAFIGYYGAGESLDPVTFTIGAKGASSAGTMTVASASVTAPIPSTPPATEGIEVSGEVRPGGRVTGTASGFRPGEGGIRVVIYSTPTVLAQDVTADAAGRVSWTGTLPEGLTGTHTLTFQGSVDRGIVLDLGATTALASLKQCTIDDATLVWGFKETFRAYIDGSIANGEWTTDGDVTYATPDFTWVGGTGSSDGEEALDVRFSGSIRFTGHGGILDTTVADPHILIDDDRAVLTVDIHGTTQTGEAVDATDVEFGELDLDGATVTRDGDTLTWTAVPATLTEEGSAAFGTYPAGEALDPLTIVATLDGGCDQPVASPTDDGIEEEPTAPAAAGWPVWATALVIVLVAALIAAAVIILVRRRRA